MLSKTNLAYFHALSSIRCRMVDLLQLRYFQAVARHQHVSRAAAELHVAQPALSRPIARLEAELGVPLFDRRGRRVRLNRFGAMFLARAGRAPRTSSTRASTSSATPPGSPRGRCPSPPRRCARSAACGRLPAGTPGELPACTSHRPGHGRPAAGGRGRPVPGLPAAAGARASPLGSSSSARRSCSPSARRTAWPDAPAPQVGELAGEPFVTTRPGYWQRALTDRLFARRGHRVRGRRALRHPRPDQRRGRHRADAGHGQAAGAPSRTSPRSRRAGPSASR